MILKKAIVYDFSKKLLSVNSLEMNKLTMNDETRILDQTSHSHVQFRKRHVIHVH